MKIPQALTYIFEAKPKTVYLHKGIAPYSTAHQYGQESSVQAYMAGIRGGFRGIKERSAFGRVIRGCSGNPWAQSANAHSPFLTAPILKASLVRPL